MKQTRKGFVEVPTTTLNALKNMLFTNEGGVDLSAIVNDIATDTTKDLTAIHVALTYKGVRVQIDERPHYTHDYRRKFIRYDYQGYSLILGVVKTKYTVCELNENGDIETVYENPETCCYGFDQWAEMTTNFEDIRQKIAERTK